ncbi:BTB/POZ domain-containing protein [Capsicum baccatum]|uniref:BTB/POZ domain-containing protein n=1 Tax=Capsicum baccatum TaxID=33114 RepID=A0A2G2VYS1_CAPBA|nr:BTB/POZ domain-containing protein [Capsicum baccatum]
MVGLLSLPGGAESFELAAKFFYGVDFEITDANVAEVCCVSDYLEMTEEYSKNNLGSRAEEHLEVVPLKLVLSKLLQVSRVWNIVVLVDSIRTAKPSVKETGGIEDLSVLRIDLYQRVITAMKCRGVRTESIAASLVNCAQKELTKKSTSLNQSSQPKVDVVSGSDNHEKVVVETIVSLMPVEKLVVPINILFGLLRNAVMLDCTVACRLDLERRIGFQLDIATLDDLLIPSIRNAGDTLFDVDTVHRILVNFSQQEDSNEDIEDVSVFESESPTSPSQTALFKVAKLVDNYLAEIAPDANLKLNKFIAIAESSPAHARTIHDGLY